MTDRVAVNYLHAFLERHQVRSYRKGEIIIFQGEAPRTAYVVKSGVVKAYNLSVNGDEKPVGFFDHYDSFPGPWMYDKTPSAVYYYEAFSDEVSVYLVPKADYL